MSKGPGRAMRWIDEYLNPERGHCIASYRGLAKDVVYEEQLLGSTEGPTRWQLYSVGRAVRRLVEMGRVVVLTPEQHEQYDIPYLGVDPREKVVMGIANGWPKKKWCDL